MVGLIGTTAYQATFAAGVSLTTTANSAILFSLSPVFSILLNIVGRRDMPRLINLFGIAFAFVGGVIIVMGNGDNLSLSSKHFLGDMLMLCAAALWALYAFYSEPSLKKYGGLKVTAWSLPAGAIGLCLLFGFQTGDVYFSTISTGAWWSLAFSVLGATVIGVVFFYQAVPFLGTQRVMSYMYLVPAIAILASWLIKGQQLHGQHIAGIMLAFFGVYLARLPKNKPR